MDDHPGMRRAMLVAAPLALLVPLAYGAAFTYLGHDPRILVALAGAAGWFVALLLRTPVGIVGMRVTDDPDRTQHWVTASSGPLEEAVRLAVLLLVGRDLSTALWIGLGWASIEVLYSIANGFALAALEARTDYEANQIKSMLPPSAFSASAPLWGVVERAWASAVHIGFTLIVAALPVAVAVTAIVHTLTNVAFLALMRRAGMVTMNVAGAAFGAALVFIGFAMHRG